MLQEVQRLMAFFKRAYGLTFMLQREGTFSWEQQERERRESEARYEGVANRKNLKPTP